MTAMLFMMMMSMVMSMVMAAIMVIKKRNHKIRYLNVLLFTYADLAPVGIRVNTVS